jgi:Transposase DDE domain group 1
VLRRQVSLLAADAALGRLGGDGEKVRRWGDFRYAAKSGIVERRVIARIEAGPQGADSRVIVTNLPGLPKSLYEKVYCARGQAENLIKAHKLHLASDRTSCHTATANQFRLLIHTAAYWLMLTLRGLAPRNAFWRDAQFDTIRLGLIKVAARVTETVTCIKVALPTAYPLPGRLHYARRPHRQAAAVADGAAAPDRTPRLNLKPRPPRSRRHRKPRLASAAGPRLRTPDE